MWVFKFIFITHVGYAVWALSQKPQSHEVVSKSFNDEVRNQSINKSLHLPYEDIESLRSDVKGQRRSLASAIWEQMGSDIEGSASGDQFGFSLALSDDGTTLAIGAFYKDGTGSSGTIIDSGEVRVFRYVSNKWMQFGQIQGEGAGDQFGTGVALSRDGTTLAVGGIKSNNMNGASTGSVRIFKLVESNQFLYWRQVSTDIEGFAEGDEFGRGVGLSDDGTIVAIGAPFVDSSNGIDSGGVVVYRYIGTSTDGVYTMMGSPLNGKGAGNCFGYSVAISGNGLSLAVGAYKSDGTSGVDSGTIRVFRFMNYGWIQVGSDIHGEMKGDQLGMSIAISQSGNVIASGAPLNDGNGYSSGSVRAYKLFGSNWVKMGDDIDGVQAGDAFGVSVSLARDGTVLAIGGFLNNFGTGYVRIYEFNSFSYSWTLHGPIIEGDSPSTLFGRSVGLSEDGNILAIGGPWGSGAGGLTSGLVRVYQISPGSPTRSPTREPSSFPTFAPTAEDYLFQNGVWTQNGPTILSPSGNATFGYSVSTSRDGKTVAVGSEFFDCSNGLYCGLVQCYYFRNGVWLKLGGDFTGSSAFENLGRSVKLSRDAKTLVIGSSKGVSVYEQVGGLWNQIGQTIVGETNGDLFGRSIDVSDDGQFVIVGAPMNDGNSGVNSGHARVYRRMNFDWVQVGSDIDGETAGDLSGFAVSMSADAGILIVSASGNADNGLYSGHVRTYAWNPILKDWSQIGSDLDGYSAMDHFGSSISQSATGTVIAVGAPLSNKYGSKAGYVRVFSLSSNNIWVQKGQEIYGEINEGLGATVSLSYYGNILAIRSYNVSTLKAKVKVFYFTEGKWMQVDNDIVTDGALSMTLSGTGSNVVIGGPYTVKSFKLTLVPSPIAPTLLPTLRPSIFPSQTISNTPSMFPSQTTSTPTKYPSNHPTILPTKSLSPTVEASDIETWTQVGGDIISQEPNIYQFGYSVSLVDVYGSSMEYSKILAVGHPQGSNKYGNVYVYKYNVSTRRWESHGNVIKGNSVGGLFGTSVKLSLDGSTVAVGSILAKNQNSEAVGKVSVYSMSNDWNLIGEFYGSRDQDQAGRSVSVSSSIEFVDGLNTKVTTVAFGIPKYDDFSTNMIDCGAVRIFRKLGDAAFQQLGGELKGASSRDAFGSSVSLSDDGKTLAVGSFAHDLSPEVPNSGRVSVYRLNNLDSWDQLGQDIKGAQSGDQAGFSISLSGDGKTIAIGIPWSDFGDSIDVGSVTIYRWNQMSWIRLVEIIGENSMDTSGYSVALDKVGTTIAIGAFQNDGTSGENSGHVRVYRQEENGWNQVGRDIDGKNSGDFFGYSVSISFDGLSIACSAILNSDNGSFSGHVKVYELNRFESPSAEPSIVSSSNTESKFPSSSPSVRMTDTSHPPSITASQWVQLPSSVSGSSAGDYFGWTTSLSNSGKTMAVAAVFSDVGGTNSGQVYIYELSSQGIWIPKGLPLYGKEAGDRFGSSIALSGNGNRIVIGAKRRSTAGATNNGETSVFEYDGLNRPWRLVGQAIEGEGSNDESGFSVSISYDGKTIGIGAPFNSNSEGTGHARVFRLISNQWVQVGQDLDAYGFGDQFGCSIALSDSGNIIAIGGFGNQGYVKVYGLVSFTNWIQLGNTIIGDGNDYFGASVSLSSDGTTVAIGSYSDYARVYKYIDNSWTLLGNEISFGYSIVSLSKDGLTLAVSDHSSNSQNGQVQIYRYHNNHWVLSAQVLNDSGTGDWFGFGMSLSGDGNVIAVGSPRHDAVATENSGKVQVYYDNLSSFVATTINSPNLLNPFSSGRYKQISCSAAVLAVSAVLYLM